MCKIINLHEIEINTKYTNIHVVRNQAIYLFTGSTIYAVTHRPALSLFSDEMSFYHRTVGGAHNQLEGGVVRRAAAGHE